MSQTDGKTPNKIKTVLLALICIALIGFSVLRLLKFLEPAEPVELYDTFVQLSPGDTVLKNGAYNPLAGELPKLGESPSDLVSDDWRSKYNDLLPARSNAPLIAIYPFVDLSEEGVGLHMTLGSQSALTAALAHGTTARILDFEPAHGGLPDILEAGYSPMKDPEPWFERVADELKASGAQYALTGVWADGTAPRERTVAVILIDLSSGEQQVLFEGSTVLTGTQDWHGYESVAPLQREFVTEVRQLLVENEILSAWTGNPGAVDHDNELAAITTMLNSADSRVIIDGIERALCLSLIYPETDTALQAAAYGITALYTMATSYQPVGASYFGIHYSLRAFGLIQLATVMNPESETTQLLELIGRASFAHMTDEAATQFGDRSSIGQNARLNGLVQQAFYDRTPISRNLVDAMPDWLMLFNEKYGSEYVASHEYRFYFDERVNHALERDNYFAAYVKNMTEGQYHSQGSSFNWIRRGALEATKFYAAQELAMFSELELDPEELEPLVEAVAVASDLEPNQVEELFNGGNYFKSRARFYKAFDWGNLLAADHQAYPLIAAMNVAARSVKSNPRNQRTISGFTGVEFSEADRIDLAEQMVLIGPLILAKFEANTFGSPQNTEALLGLILNARTDHGEAWADAADMYQKLADGSADRARVLECRQNAVRACPYEPYLVINLASAQMELGDKERALKILNEMNRMDPFAPLRFFDSGDFYYRYRFVVRGSKNYEIGYRAYPDRHDKANQWAELQCEMGRADNPFVAQTYATGVRQLVGNSDFHEANLNYLVYHKKDFDEARRWATFFTNTQGRRGHMWHSWIEREAGDTAAAIKALDDMPIDRSAGSLRAAADYATVSSSYRQMGELEKAEKLLNYGKRIDSYQGTVIMASARLALAKKDYDLAAAEAQRYVDRYGASASCDYIIALCLIRTGKPELGITMMKDWVMLENHHLISNRPCRDLMRICVELEDVELANKTMDQILRSSLRRRNWIIECANLLEELDPVRAEEIRNDIDAIIIERKYVGDPFEPEQETP